MRYVSFSGLGFVLLVQSLACPNWAYADFVPIPLTAESFNQDVVVENTALAPVVVVTTASMDTGITNTGFGWFERGYNLDWPATGLPVAGERFTSEAQVDHDYHLAPSYKTNNVVLIDNNSRTGTLTLKSPARYSGLSFLTTGANGGGIIAYTVYHQDGSTETGNFSCPDWWAAVGQAWTAHGRIDVTAFTYGNIGSDYPRIYSRDISLTNTLSVVTRITFQYTGGAGHLVVFGVSGASFAGDAFVPIDVTGFNQDMVVEASAAKPRYIATASTASMETGAMNTRNTWYEQGYVPTAPATGLPLAGSLVTNIAAADHRYLMPLDYKLNNAILVDLDSPVATVVPSSFLSCSALSFLGAAGNGPVTNSCVTRHADGTAETNTFALPDWFDMAPGAFSANGRVNLNNRIVNSINSGFPRLFSADLALANFDSPVTNLVLSFAGGSTNSHAVIFAVSGWTGAAPPPRPTLSITANADGSLTLASTGPGKLQSAAALDGTNTAWLDEGSITTTITVTPAPGQGAKFYRVVAQ